MSRYLLLFLLNLPFVLVALVSAMTRYKLGRSSKKRLLAQSLAWLFILAGLALAESIYNWLFQNELTQTEPLSLFDVIQITAIVIIIYLVNRSRTKIETLERRVHELHRELSIELSNKL